MTTRLILAAAALAILVAGGPAVAAERPARATDWTGFYLGPFIGGAWGLDVDVLEGVSQGGAIPPGTPYNATTTPYGYDLDASVIAGLTAGYNWHIGGWPLVIGLEGEIGYLSMEGSRVDPNSVALFGGDTRDRTSVGDWYSIVGARSGYVWDRALFYLKAGAAILEVETSVVDACTTGACGSGRVTASGDKTAITWALGAGVEWAWAANWSLKAEYVYIGLDETIRTCGPGAASAAGSTHCWTHDVGGIHTAKIGINYRFGGR